MTSRWRLFLKDALRSTPPKESYASLEGKVAARTAELSEALERQTATAEILRVISSSITDTQPVFDAIVQSCRRLFGGKAVHLAMPRGDVIESVAFASDSEDRPKGIGFLKPWPLDRGSGAGTCILDGRVIAVADTLEGARLFPRMPELAIALGYRSCLFVPLLRDGKALGSLTILRATTGEFQAQELALAQTFADQAVIAIENARLFNETQEALRQQKASAEVLAVISNSVADTQPVFEKILDSCKHLFGGDELDVLLVDAQGRLQVAAYVGKAHEAVMATFPAPLAGSAPGRAITERRVVHYADVLNDPDTPPVLRRMGKVAGYHSVAFAPMLWEDRGIGVIGVARSRGAFSDKELALLQTFADQAVIAIQNARLFNETKEALERQTATAEILKVIAASPADVQPVFDAIAASSKRLLDGYSTAVWRFRDEAMHLVGFTPGTPEGDAALQQLSGTALDRFQYGHRIVAGETVLVTDTEDEAQSAAEAREVARARGFRSMVLAPLRRDNASIGMLSVTRREPGQFTLHQIELLQAFADQAVIAIENVRLFNETREALERQTVTAEVLRVVGDSMEDTTPVFQRILRSCHSLLGVERSVAFEYGARNTPRLVTSLGDEDGALWGTLTAAGFFRSAALRAYRDRRVLTYNDVLSGVDVPPEFVAAAQRCGRSFSAVVVPIYPKNELSGAILAMRQAGRKFTPSEIELLQTFASQGEIAIRNRDLLLGMQSSLAQQRVSSEVLKVIGRSPTDPVPIFNAIAEGARQGVTESVAWVVLSHAKTLEIAAVAPPGLSGHPNWHRFLVGSPDRDSLNATAILKMEALKVDMRRVGLHAPTGGEDFASTGFQALMIAPILQDGVGIGTVGVAFRHADQVPPEHFELIWTFADQAVIAIQNARLFNETKEALEQQTATAEVLQVISSSVADAKPVFDKILDSCERLFAATGLGIYLIDDADMLQMGAFRGAAVGAIAGGFPRRLEGTATAIAVRERRVVHYPDVLGAPDAPALARQIAETTGNYSMAFAPMLWEERGVGVIQVTRAPPTPFTDKDLTLLKTFADQAVIAVQNARLFNEIQAKSRELELANKHKSEFLANMSHELRTPLNAIIGFSEVLSEKMFGEVNDKQLEYLLDIHSSGHHLLSLINDILDLSKIEAGRMELDLTTTNLPMLLDNCTTLVRERASRQGLVLALEIEAGVGDWVADVRKLKQVVINLLSNAVKFTPAGGRVTLRARRLEHAVEIAVVDTGVGIAADQQALVFEEFRQAGGDYLRKAEGTGLGLALARRFVELHGGTIRVESEPGRGSTFAFVLPERVLEAT